MQYSHTVELGWAKGKRCRFLILLSYFLMHMFSIIRHFSCNQYPKFKYEPKLQTFPIKFFCEEFIQRWESKYQVSFNLAGAEQEQSQWNMSYWREIKEIIFGIVNGGRKNPKKSKSQKLIQYFFRSASPPACLTSGGRLPLVVKFFVCRLCWFLAFFVFVCLFVAFLDATHMINQSIGYSFEQVHL